MVGREEIEQPFVEDASSMTSFMPYPSNKPFINSGHELKKPTSKAFPESNRDAILDALKKMQSKLKQIEKDSAQNNLNVYTAYPVNPPEGKNSEVFSSSTSQDNFLVNSSATPNSQNDLLDRQASCCLSFHLKNIEQISEKTLSTESRVNELEKQLEKMKKILDQVKEEPENRPSKKKDKISPINVSISDSPVLRPKRSKTKSPERSTVVRSKSAHVQQRSSNPKIEIPFIVGTSVSPSHNLGVNIQNIRSLFKICSPKRFQTINGPESNCQTRNRSRSNGSRNQNGNCERNLAEYELECEVDSSSMEIVSLDSQYSNDSSNSSSQIDFDELLCILQEEYTKLVLHQYEKTKQIMGCNDYELRDQLERQVDMLKKKIQIKTRQIEKVKKYQKSQKKINQIKENNLENSELKSGHLARKKKAIGSTKKMSNKLNGSIVTDQANSSMCQNHLKNLSLLKEIKYLKQTILT